MTGKLVHFDEVKPEKRHNIPRVNAIIAQFNIIGTPTFSGASFAFCPKLNLEVDFGKKTQKKKIFSKKGLTNEKIVI